MFETIQKSNNKNDFIWAFKYSPRKLSDLILLNKHKTKFKKIIDTFHCPDLLLYGNPGTGKSTLVNVLINELDFDALCINGSLDTSIDVIRSDVRNFTKRSSGKQKLVYIDELDRMSTNAMDSLKAEIESCQKTAFIFTSNHVENVIPPLVSRCGGGISFFFNNDEKKELQKKYYKRCLEILEEENVEYEPKAVAKVIQSIFPDMRNIIHSLQDIFNQYGKIELNAVDSLVTTDFDKFFDLIKTQDFMKIRTYCANLNSDYKMFYGSFLSKIEKYIDPSSIPSVIDSCYTHQQATVGNPDPQLPLVHFAMSLLNEKIK